MDISTAVFLRKANLKTLSYSLKVTYTFFLLHAILEFKIKNEVKFKPIWQLTIKLFLTEKLKAIGKLLKTFFQIKFSVLMGKEGSLH